MSKIEADLNPDSFFFSKCRSRIRIRINIKWILSTAVLKYVDFLNKIKIIMIKYEIKIHKLKILKIYHEKREKIPV